MGLLAVFNCVEQGTHVASELHPRNRSIESILWDLFASCYLRFMWDAVTAAQAMSLAPM